MYKIKNAIKAVLLMEQYLQHHLKEDQRWENSFIKLQYDKRNKGQMFSLQDHIRAMVYSMLTSQTMWARIANDIDPTSKRLVHVDEIFFQYDPEKLICCKPEEVIGELCRYKYGGQSRKAQVEAVVQRNVPKLIEFQNHSSSVDEYYAQIMENSGEIQVLIHALSHEKSNNKLAQMGIPLVAEYLRNVGYDVAKPDRHICRILGRDYLGCSEEAMVPPYQAMKIVLEIAQELCWPQQKVDYTLWAYCAQGYGEVCTKAKPKCDKCTVHNYCNNLIEEEI
jgi:thermostable 8-oxoguanine DNA glycosylase